MPMWFIRLLNRWGWRKDDILCMSQEDTWRWPSNLDKKTEGVCAKCNEPVCFEYKNRHFRKICNRCGLLRID